MIYSQLATRWVSVALLCLMFAKSWSSAAVTFEPKTDSYHFVTHYRINIDAPPATVWQHLIDLKSWMYEFELSQLHGASGQPGQVLRLYENQDFEVLVTAAIDERMLAIANLPLTFRQEYGTGNGVMTLHNTETGTELSLTMTRRYTWKGEGENPLLLQRQSTAFQQRTRDMWQGRFLTRLKELAEAQVQRTPTSE